MKARLSDRLYGGGHRLLQRARLERLLDYYWCEVLLSARTPLPPSSWDRDSLWMGEVHLAQLDWLAAFAPQNAHEFPTRWAQQRRCFAAALDRVCVGYLWIATGPSLLASAQGFPWDLPPHSAWIFDALFHPLVLGTYPDLARFAAGHLRREGFHFMLGQVEYDNRISRRVHRMLGGQRLGWIATLRLAGLAIHLDHRSPRSWALRLGRTPVPLAAFLPPAEVAASARPARAA